MKKQFIYLFFIFFYTYTQGYGQLDGGFNKKKDKNSSSFGIISSSAKKVKKPSSLNFSGDNGFKTAHSKQEKDYKKKKAQQDFENKGILTKKRIAEEQYLKAFKKINGQYQYPVIDQDLGSFSTKSKSVTIICRDFQYPDGDKVTLYINKIPVVKNITLKRRFQSFDIPLDDGINTIEILALNQGTSGPNTAEFKIFNDNGMLISSNQWNLATSAKASIIIAKQK